MKPGIQSAREHVHELLLAYARWAKCLHPDHNDDCTRMLALVEARDSHLREVHAREVAELRAKVIEECALQVRAHHNLECACAACEQLRLAAARIRALGGKVEP